MAQTMEVRRRAGNWIDVSRRGLQVGVVFTRGLFVPWMLRHSTPSRAERLQVVLEELGGTWIKLGQALAMRFDLLPADYCLQFFQLLNQVRPFPSAAVRQVIETELHQPVEQLFRSFDWTPVAAASIGQVHRAELEDGTVVAVKVQRPGIRELVRADLRLMRWLAAVIDAVPFAGMHAREFVREFSHWTEEELDYRAEARHAAVLRQNAEGDPFECNPRIFQSHTTSRVLTLDYLDGTPVIDIVSALRRNDSAFLERLADEGHDPRRIASRIVWNGLNQIYRFGYFHADPHPANLVVLADDAIGYMDFGIVGKFDEQLTTSLRYFAQHLFAGDVGKALDEFMRFLTPSSHTDLVTARRDLTEALTNYLESERVAPGGWSQPEQVFEIEMLAIVRRHGMLLAPDVVRYLKAVLTTDALVRELDPELDLRAHENRFFRRLMQIELGEALNLRHAAQWLVDARFRLNRLVETVDNMRDAPAHLLAAADTVQRRVQISSLIAIAGFAIVLAAMVTLPGRLGPTILGFSLRGVLVGVGLVSLVVLVFSVLEVRRLQRAAAQTLERFPPARR